MQCLCYVSIQHAAIILSADTPLNSNNKHCLFHFQWVTVDAAVLVLCVSPTSGNVQTLHLINSNINKHCLFHFQWITAVDAVLMLHISPALNNTKCRCSTVQTLFVPLSMIMIMITGKGTACILDQHTIVQLNITQKQIQNQISDYLIKTWVTENAVLVLCSLFVPLSHGSRCSACVTSLSSTWQY